MDEKIEITRLTKLSYNDYINLHWRKRKVFKDNLRWMVMYATKKRYTGAYHLDFYFEFKGNKLDTINVVHYCKIIEDLLFKQDRQNRRICINVDVGKTNKCLLKLTEV